MKALREILFMVRILGVRDGLRTWLLVRDAAPVAPRWSPHHGERPTMPGYRMRRRR